jgi:hypothetical protein
MTQQLVNRTPSGTANSRSAYGSQSHTQLERPQSSSSKVELTQNKAGLDQSITKTTAWKTSTDTQDAWSNNSGLEDHFPGTDFQATNVASAQSEGLHR